jgi:glucose-6-phosphate 1-dehydrogenase
MPAAKLTRDFPTILVVFGATGDLMTKKVVPALFNLYEKKTLPKLLNIVGFSRREWNNEQFQEHVLGILKKYKATEVVSEEMQKFAKIFTYHQGQFENKADYLRLAKYLGRIDGEWRLCANKLFYLAVSPEFYKGIFKLLDDTELTKPCSPEEGWTRVLVEKPFGKDLKTAEELDKLLATFFKEVQIYRIDHYLAKEMLQSILSFRFSNNLFEANWGNHAIEKIEIRTLEDIGVEKRGTFYDGIGAFRDVGQNHLLQMLALVTMEQPVSFDADDIRRERAKLLTKLHIPTATEISATTFRAQYEGYQTIPNVKPNSTTETYFRVKATIDSDRWNGVPIYLESGKRMGKPRKEIVVTFKHVEPCFCLAGSEHYKNKVVFSLEPEEGISVSFWTKKPGLQLEMEKRTLDFTLRQPHERQQYIEEYAKLLLDSINGDQTLFVSTNEIKSMWSFSDPVSEAWAKNAVPLVKYLPDTMNITSEAKIIEKDSASTSMPRQFGLIGLGKMGANMARRMAEKGWKVNAFNRTTEVATGLNKENSNIVAYPTVRELITALPSPKVVWLMVPAGEAVDEMLFGKEGIVKLLKKGDIVIDGGNSFYKDTISRNKKLTKLGIKFMDTGTSGGPGGARTGACLMIGGDEKTFQFLKPLYRDFAKDGAYEFFTGSGAGHFVKMVHNGIEYGMMQAIAEGYAVLKKSKFKLNLINVSKIYNNGSVIESRLIGWLKKGLEIHGDNLKDVPGKVGHTGEGLWTVKTAKELKLKAKVIEESLKFRVQSTKNPSYTGKILMTLREQFGGHKK